MSMYEEYTIDKKPNCQFCINFIHMQKWEDDFLISDWKECKLKLINNGECKKYNEFIKT